MVKRQSQTFEVLPHRWVVERTFAWFINNDDWSSIMGSYLKSMRLLFVQL
ncbi:hypothetical protein [Fischerella sp. JS2]